MKRIKESKPIEGRKITVKLFGGPLGGSSVTIPASAEVIHFGPRPNPFFTYTYAGKQERTTCFAISPRSRAARRIVHWYVGEHGRDPRVEAEFHRGRSLVRHLGEKFMQKFQRGAQKRRDARANAPDPA